MTDDHTPDAQTHDIDEGAAAAVNEADVWTPPASLPAPTAKGSRPPIEAALAVVAVSLAAGVALWASGQVFYIYIFYNVLVGGAIGWALPSRQLS